MKVAVSLAVVQAIAVQGIRIIQGNDDGWAELYTHSFFDALTASGHDVVLSAPADNKSGTGSTDVEPDAREAPCQYDSCPANSGPTGTDPKNPRFNWVDSFPVTGMRFGLEKFGPAIWKGQAPELAVAGPNVGDNLFLSVQFSGTVGAATYAVKEAGIPAIAFSGASEGRLPWTTKPVPERSLIYADLANNLTSHVIESGAPYLPEGIFLNVNFPKVEGECTKASAFKYVLTRINPITLAEPDVEWCGTTRLPAEKDVIEGGGCFVSVSVGDATDKTTADAARQKATLAKLKGILSCLP